MKNKLIIIIFGIIFPTLINAKGVLDDLPCIQDGSCTLPQMEQGITLFISRLVGLIGAVALLYLIYGGLRWLTSGGVAKNIEDGKNAIKGSLIAIIIALLAGVFIRFYTEELFQVKEYTQTPVEEVGKNLL